MNAVHFVLYLFTLLFAPEEVLILCDAPPTLFSLKREAACRKENLGWYRFLLSLWAGAEGQANSEFPSGMVYLCMCRHACVCMHACVCACMCMGV